MIRQQSSRPTSSGVRGAQRRGMLLVVVLMIITILGLLSASFAYRMSADLASVTAVRNQQQARLAAESGLARVMLWLRDHRTNVDEWYHNPKVFRRILVWAPDKKGGSESLADQEKVDGRPAWRFSVVRSEPQGPDKAIMQYGVTDEASKINLNVAPRGQLIALFDQIPNLENVTSVDLADALIDWLDEDDIQTGSRGAESNYYITMNPPYRAKNGRLDTLEELLMVRGFNGRILYGEDYNRNGYLDPNEDDGPEGSWPPDNGDGKLDRGLLPLVTVNSWDLNLSSDNKTRTDINSIQSEDADKLPKQVAEGLGSDTIRFIVEARKRGFRFRSVGELYGLQVYEDGSSNYDAAWRQFRRLNSRRNRLGLEVEGENTTQDPNAQPGGNQSENQSGKGDGKDQDSEDNKDQGRQGQQNGGNSSGRRNNAGGDSTQDGRGNDQGSSDEENDKDKKKQRQQKPQIAGEHQDNNDRAEGSSNPQDPNKPKAPKPGGDGGEGGGGQQPGSEDHDGDEDSGETGKGKGTPISSPVSEAELAAAMDLLTVVPSPIITGQINVNTAPAEVLRTLPMLTEEQVSSIVSRRAQIQGEDKLTPAWLVAGGMVDAETFAVLSNLLTTRSLQFTVDVIGFADHVGVAKRIQAIVEMRGHVAQVRYYRDITELGLGYPVWDDERTEGFGFQK